MPDRRDTIERPITGARALLRNCCQFSGRTVEPKDQRISHYGQLFPEWGQARVGRREGDDQNRSGALLSF